MTGSGDNESNEDERGLVSRTIEGRTSEHLKALMKNKHPNKVLQTAYNLSTELNGYANDTT